MFFALLSICTFATPSFATERWITYNNSRKIAPWIPTIINHGLEIYVPSGVDRNNLCTVHGEIYDAHLRNLTLWAVQMVDASSRGPSGLLTGNNYQFGDFNECISVYDPEHDIRGKYLVVNFRFWRKIVDDSVTINTSNVFNCPSPASPSWEVFQATNDRRIRERNSIHWALCVPQSCTDEDIEHSLAETMASIAKHFEVIINVTVTPKFTYSNASPTSTSTTFFYIFIGITTLMISLVLVATAQEVKNGKALPDASLAWLGDMSLLTNYKKLMKFDSQEFPSISGLKAISMLLIIFGHRMMITTFSPLFNQQENEMQVGTFTYTLIRNGALVVNTYLVITGFLTYHKIVKDIENDKSINVFTYIYHRWIRLTPLYAYVMAFDVVIRPLISSGGPLGRSVIWDSKCSGSTAWWTQLFYINNYIHPSEQCLITSWYLAADMQLYIVCAICGYVLWAHRATGLALLRILLVISIIVPGIVVIRKHYSGVFLFYFDDFDSLIQNTEFVETYFYTHNRASPYIIGMAGGYLYYQIKSRKLDWSRRTVWALFLSGVTIHTVTWLGAWIFYLPGRPFYLGEHVSYAILHKVGWALSICIYILCASHFRLGILKSTIGAKIFRPLSTLSYAALLIHSPIQLLLAGLNRSPPYYNEVLSVWMACGDIFFSYVAALLLHLFIEAPLARLKDLRLRHIYNCIGRTTVKPNFETEITTTND